MLSKNRTIICVSLNENTFDAVLLKKIGASYCVMNVVSENVNGLDDNARSKVIHSAISPLNPKAATVACILSSNLITTKNIEIPSINEEEIKSIVNLQAGRHTPFSREEIEIGFVNIGTYKTNFTKVLLVIANKGVVKEQLDVLSNAGVRSSYVLFSPEGIATLYEKSCAAKGAGSPVAIIDIGENSTDFVVAHHGKAVVTRNIPFGKKQMEADGEIAQEKWVGEIAQTVNSYKTEDIGEAPKAYLITTDDNVSRSLQEGLKVKLNANVEIDAYVDNIQVASTVIKKIAVEYSKTSFLNIVSPVCGMSKKMIDLFPSEVRMQQSMETQGKEIVKTTILVFLLFSAFVCFFELRAFLKANVLSSLKKEYASTHEEVNSLKNISMKTKMVDDFFRSRMISLDVVNELYNIIPDDVYITSLIMDETGSINLQGVADTASVVFNLGTAFKESAFFSGVEIKSTSSKKDRGKDVAAFEMVLKVKSMQKSEEEKATKE